MKLNIGVILLSIFIYLLVSATAAWLFYDRIGAGLFFLPFFPLFLREVKKAERKRYEERMTEGFLKAITNVAMSMSAGISAENAFRAASAEVKKLCGSGAEISKELGILNSQLSAGKRLGDALSDLAKRTQIPEIRDFAAVFFVAKDKGGDCPKVISSCIGIMESRRRAENEARVLIRAKQYEQRIMCFIPPAIMAYLRLSSGGFMDVLYHNVFGYSVMTACLFIYVLAVLWSEKIEDMSI